MTERPARPAAPRPTAYDPARFATTRWAATVTTFGPRLKLAVTVPAFVPALAFGSLLLSPPNPFWTLGFVGLLCFGWAAVWWARQVWVPGRLEPGPAAPAGPAAAFDPAAERDRRPDHGSLTGDARPPTRW